MVGAVTMTDLTEHDVSAPVPDTADVDAPPASGPGRRWVAPALTGTVLAAGCAAVALADPGDQGVSVCWSKTFLGVDCPFCGGLRATNSLLRGHWLEAADHNVLLAIALPAAAALWLVWMVQALRGRDFRLPRVPRPVMWAGIGVLVVFTVLRNLPVDSGWIHWLASGTA